jgi:predicted NBD/HSP70 family sugar kinase
VVTDLISAGIVREGDGIVPSSGGAGRPAVPITLDPSAGAALGIDLAHDGIRVIVTDLAHQVLKETWEPIALEHMETGAVLESAARAVRAALEAAGVMSSRLVGAAVSVPSPIDPDTGILGAESVIPSLAGVNVGGRLSELLGFPVRADNDANLCALAEFVWGAAPGHRNMVYVKLSRGIGSGLILGGSLYHGVHGGAGELGHTPVLSDGPPCRCGNRGCLEAVAGSESIIELVAGRFPEPPTIAAVVDLAMAGDTICRRALRDVGSMMGTALAATVNLLNPSLIVIGGEMETAFRLMEVPIREAMDRAAIYRSAADVVVIPGSLGRRAEALGAVALVLRESPDLAGVG